MPEIPALAPLGAQIPQKGALPDKKPPNCHSQRPQPRLRYQNEEFDGMTLQDALIAYKTHAKAEGKGVSSKGVEITSSGEYPTC
jgi:hypothetical protein